MWKYLFRFENSVFFPSRAIHKDQVLCNKSVLLIIESASCLSFWGGFPQALYGVRFRIGRKSDTL